MVGSATLVIVESMRSMNVATMSTAVATVRDRAAPRSWDLSSFFMLRPSHSSVCTAYTSVVSTLYAGIVVGAIRSPRQR